MKNKLKTLNIIGLIWEVAASFIFHFLYEWTSNNNIVGLFTPISESVWEHGKLLVFPFLLFIVIEYFLLKPKDKTNYWATKLFIIIINTILLPILFYTYSGIIGQNFLVVDILIAILLVVLSYSLNYLLTYNNYTFKHKCFVITLGITIILAFFIFTFYPPNLPWFNISG